MKTPTKKTESKAVARKRLVVDALRVVRALVKQYDSSIVQSALNTIKDEERADRELREAEEKVALLKKKAKKRA